MIRNIVFDMGNVLIKFAPLDYLNQTFKDKLAIEEVYRELFCKEEWIELDRGTLTEKEALVSVCARIPAYSEYVKQAMTGWFIERKPIEGMYELVRDVKQKGYRIYLLSNASPRIYEYKDKIPAINFFDGYLISCDIKVNKPDREIYEALLRKYDLIAQECIFIDDLQRNIEGAKAVGIQGHVFQGAAELRQFFIRQQILKEPPGIHCK